MNVKKSFKVTVSESWKREKNARAKYLLISHLIAERRKRYYDVLMISHYIVSLYEVGGNLVGDVVEKKRSKTCLRQKNI